MTPEEFGKAGPAESALVTLLSCLSLGAYLLGNAAFQQELWLIFDNIEKAVERIGW